PAVGSRRPPPVPEGLRDLAGGHPDPAFLPDLVPPGRLSPGARSHRASPRMPQLEELSRAWFRRDGVPDAHVTFAHGALDCGPRAQNPFGARVSATRREELLEVLAAAPETLVAEDDHSADIAGGPLHSLVTAGTDGPARWAHIRTVSKHMGTDLRWTAMAGDA